MSTAMQLTLDNKAIPYAQTRSVPRLGNTQRAVMRRLALEPLDTGQLRTEIPGGDRAVRRLRRREMVEKHFDLWFVSKGWE